MSKFVIYGEEWFSSKKRIFNCFLSLEECFDYLNRKGRSDLGIVDFNINCYKISQSFDISELEYDEVFEDIIDILEFDHQELFSFLYQKQTNGYIIIIEINKDDDFSVVYL